MTFALKTLNRVLGIALIAMSLQTPFALAAEPIHIVFDIDWTLTSTLPSDFVIPSGAEGARYLKFEGQTYRIADGVEETLRSLLRYPHVKISFFSGAEKKRNEAILRSIILDPKLGITAFDRAEKTLSFDDLDDLYQGKPIPEGVRFTDRYRKNLTRHFESRSRTIILDDTQKFISESEITSLLHIFPTYDFYRNYADVEATRTSGKATLFTPPTLKEWEIERARIPIAGLMLEEAIEADLRSVPGAHSLSLLDHVRESANRTKITYLKRLRRNPVRANERCPGLLEAFRPLTPSLR